MTTFGPLKRFSAIAVTMHPRSVKPSTRFIQPMRNRYPLTQGGLSVFLVCCCLAGISILYTGTTAAQVASTPHSDYESTDRSDELKADTELSAAQSWLVTPTLAADPKLGATVGGVIAYLKKLDEESTASVVGVTVSYSDTDSITAGVGAQLFWGADAHRLTLLAGGAEINNEYDDFLGTGQTAETKDSVHAVGFRYLKQIGKSDWLAGVQGISTNYAVGADGYIDGILNIVGLSGFDATGLGLVLQHDTMDDQRDPAGGHLLSLHNMAYREGLGGETSFDVIYTDFRWYHSMDELTIGQSNRPTVLALQLKGRFTEDAPLSGFSSVTLPGYTMGNYLSEDYVHMLIEGRVPITRKFGIVAFGGVGCQFGDDIAGQKINCSDHTFPSVGAGVSYMLKEEASVLIRLEIAKGKNDNEALYLRFGHAF